MVDLVAVVLGSFAVYFFTVIRPTGIVNANAIFVYLQIIMAVGTLLMLTQTSPVDVMYGYIVSWSVLTYLLTSSIVALRRPPVLHIKGHWSKDFPPVQIYRPTVTMWLIVGASILVVLLYYWAVGYSALLEGLRNSFTHGDQDIAGARLASYSGSRYLFPGYVNQFKNALLPALAVVAMTYWIHSRRSHRVLGVLLLGFTTLALVGTGQRGAFIQFCIITVIYLYFLNGRRLKRATWVVGFAGLIVIVVATIALGRSNASLALGATIWDRVGVAFAEIGHRVFVVQQASAVTGFHYIFTQPIQGGREWLQGLAGVLPGRGGSDLSNRIYAGLYGSTRGTAPPSIWGSIYHNFGMLGIATLPGFLGLAFGAVSRRASAPVDRNSLELIGIAGVCTTLGFWVSGSPDTLLNSGLVVYVILWQWGTRARISNSSPTIDLGTPGHDLPRRTTLKLSTHKSA